MHRISRLGRIRVSAGAIVDALLLVLVAAITYTATSSLGLAERLRASSAAPLELPRVAVILAVGLTLALLAWRRATRNADERRRSATVLRRQAALLDLARDAVVVCELHTNTVTFWNQGAEAMFGWPRADVLGKPVELVLPTRYPEPRAAIVEALQRVGRWDGELIQTHRDGSTLTVSSRWSMERDEHGQAVAIFGISTDITARKRVEVALQERETSLQAAQEIVHLGSWTWDIAAGSLLWSDELFRIMGRDRGSFPVTRVSFLECLHPEDRTLIDRLVQQALNDHRPFETDLRVIRPDGTERVTLSRARVELDAGGVPVKVMGTALDVTEQRRTAELVRARDAAEAASQAKSEFLANMSHEIRTPMNAILGMADLLAETPLTGEQQEYVGIFRRSGDTLLTLIDDILDLSKVEAGRLTLEAARFDLHGLVEDTVEVLAARAHAKGLELTCEVGPDVPAWVSGDPQRLRQVLLNLLGNAVKFTASGEVGLRVERDPSDATLAGTLLVPPATVRFSVRDTGIGIPADKLESVFGAFTQVDASTTRRYGGTGLGLAIVERLVSLMGGRIAVASTPGQGATFAFSIPFEPAAVGSDLAQDGPAAELAGARVLVVDDNATNRLLLMRLLAAHGAAVSEADGGEAGLAALRAARCAGRPYDLLLLDQQMPAVDGFHLVARLRDEAPDGAPGVAGDAVARAILMLSSDRRVGDAARAGALGITHYLVKPVKRAALLRAIVSTLRGRDRPPPPPPAGRAAAGGATAPPAAVPGQHPDGSAVAAVPARRRVLLVDDSADNRRLVQLYLSKLPYVLETAIDGRAGLEAFTAGRFDLVLMDVHMPVMDGLASTRAIRAWELAHGRPPTPIVALTASVMTEDIRQAMAAGCDAHLAKPLKKAVLLAALVERTAPETRRAVPAT